MPRVDIAELLSREMPKKGLNQETFAGRIGVHQTTVSGWIRKVRSPSFEDQKRIAKGLAISLDRVQRAVGNTALKPRLTLRAQVESLESENDSLRRENEALLVENDRLEKELRRLQGLR